LVLVVMMADAPAEGMPRLSTQTVERVALGRLWR
jgi:hypothetical protein